MPAINIHDSVVKVRRGRGVLTMSVLLLHCYCFFTDKV